MEKRIRLEKAISGDPVDRSPTAIWRHWQGDDQRSADFARAIITFQNHFDWDFVVVQPAPNFDILGYGLQDVWRGDISGKRDITKRVIQRSLDWTELRPFSPDRGELGKQLECLRLLQNAFASDNTPYIQVIYSPLAQAERLSGRDILLQHMRTRPDRLKSALNNLTETTLRFMDAMRRTGVSGILFVTEQASYDILTDEEYTEFGLPYDRKIIEAVASNWWLNIIQVRGKVPMLHLFADYPVQVLSWSDQEARPPLERAPAEFRGALLGGLGENEHLHLSTPAVIRDTSRKAINTIGKRIILGCGGAVPITTPLSNMQAVRDIVEQMRTSF